MKISLGTVQFGLEYGINNQTGKPTQSTVNEILSCAQKSGITQLDSSINYGDSLQVLSQFPDINKFQVSSKFCAQDLIDSNIPSQVTQTLQTLKLKHLEILYFHDFSDATNPKYIDELQELQNQSIIKKVGVSLYTIEQFEQAIKMQHINSIQLPFNVFDRSVKKIELINEARKAGKEIIARSLFLQGLFFKKIEQLTPRLSPLAAPISQLQKICQKNSLTIFDITLRYVYSRQYIDQCLIGVDTPEQLQKNIASYQVPIGQDLIDEIENIKIDDLNLLNPVNWK